MLDFEKLLEPISQTDPTGPNLRLIAADATFTELDRKLRGSNLLHGSDRQAFVVDWAVVSRECAAALTDRSKDLELAAILALALAGSEGWEGLGQGLRLVRELLALHWPRLHPGFVDGEIVLAVRARPLSWLVSSRECLDVVKKIPLAFPKDAPQRGYFDFEQSQIVDLARTQNQKRYEELLADGHISGTQWREALSGTPRALLEGTSAAIKTCLTEVGELEKLCSLRFETQALAIDGLRRLVQDCRDFVRGCLEDTPERPTAAPAAVGHASIPAAGHVSMVGPDGGQRAMIPDGAIASRHQAYSLLRLVADYLRNAEPHSPVSLLLERAVRWGDMSFDDLLNDVVKSEDARVQVREVLGLPAPPEG
jgi:type VI secretion system protein ImpA